MDDFLPFILLRAILIISLILDDLVLILVVVLVWRGGHVRSGFRFLIRPE